MLRNKNTLLSCKTAWKKETFKVYTELIRTFLNRAFPKSKVQAASELR